VFVDSKGRGTIIRQVFLLMILVSLEACQSSWKDKSLKAENDVWLFAYDSNDVGLDQHWYDDSTDRRNWTRAQSGPWADKSYSGAAWYASTFTILDTIPMQSIVFGGVADDAEVWINGRLAGSHTGDDESFAFDLPDIRLGTNKVVVRAVGRGGSGGLLQQVRIVRSNEVNTLLKSKLSTMNARKSADWVRDAVIYEVYLRSFSKEGTFRGLQKRLQELKSLGVTVVWLMPIHPVGELGRKGRLGSPYSVQDYYGINPEFGTLDDFKLLVASVHRLGMKIIIDLVANHTSWDSKLMFDHPEWFAKNKEGLIVSPNADWTDVAQLDYRHHELRKYMIKMMVYWVRDIGIDGYRCDVADLLPLDFWETARQALDEIKPVMMLAEGKNPDDHLKAFDLTYSWNVYDVLSEVVREKRTVNILDQKLGREHLRYPKNALRMRFISNHDKNVQDGPSVQLYSKAGAKAAAALIFTLPGVPLIYNGDEVGNSKKLNLTDKVDIDGSQDGDFRREYTKLAELRGAHPALREGSYQRIWCSDSTRVFAFQRVRGNDTVCVLINFSKANKDVRIKSTVTLFDLRADKMIKSEKGKVALNLSPYQYSLLIPSQTKENK